MIQCDLVTSAVVDDQMFPISTSTSQHFPGHVNTIKILTSVQFVDNSSSSFSKDNICVQPDHLFQDFLSMVIHHVHHLDSRQGSDIAVQDGISQIYTNYEAMNSIYIHFLYVSDELQ